MVVECVFHNLVALIEVLNVVWPDIVRLYGIVEGFNPCIILRSMFLYVFDPDSEKNRGLPELFGDIPMSIIHYECDPVRNFVVECPNPCIFHGFHGEDAMHDME